MVKNRLRILMAEKRLNISELAKQSGISRNSISAIYNEKSTMIRLDTINTLCKYLECTPNDLFIISYD